MKNKIVIFDPPMCCSSGICGPNPDTTLIDFQDLFAKFLKSGTNIERYLITQSPEKFKENSEVIKLIQEKQLACLPITTLNGKIVKSGSYSTSEELEMFTKEK